MPRGGSRERAGRKSKWNHGRTKMIRVPESLAESILEIAHKLDEQESIGFESNSYSVDLSTLNIPTIRGKRFVFLQDLLRLGYEIKPLSLAENVRKELLK
jgi:hypothetical protein